MEIKYMQFHISRIPGAARAKAWVCGHSLARIARSNPAGGMDVSCESRVLSGSFCDGVSLVKSGPTDCGV